MKRSVNFSKDNLPVQWQYVKTNLKELGVWGEVELKAKGAIKEILEGMIKEDFDLTIASNKYERTPKRLGYRSGYYQRSLLTKHGRIDMCIPKARRTPVKYRLFKIYQRRQDEFDEQVLKAMILGLTSRKQMKFFKSFIGDSISHTTASKIINKMVYIIDHYRSMQLLDEYKYLYLDAIWIHIKELNISNKPILIALGVKADGSKHIIAFKLAQSESEDEWISLVNDLYRRGLKGLSLNLIISDNCPGLKSAINYCYPYVPLQLCTVHKLRNILSKIKDKRQNRRKLIQQASGIFKSETKQEAITRYNAFLKEWLIKEPLAVKTIQKDTEYYFTYFNFPQELRNSLKSTNPLERINRELRKITRRLGYFQSQRSLDVFVYSTLKEEGLIIDGSFEVMPNENKTFVSLEFAKDS